MLIRPLSSTRLRQPPDTPFLHHRRPTLSLSLTLVWAVDERTPLATLKLDIHLRHWAVLLGQSGGSGPNPTLRRFELLFAAGRQTPPFNLANRRFSSTSTSSPFTRAAQRRLFLVMAIGILRAASTSGKRPPLNPSQRISCCPSTLLTFVSVAQRREVLGLYIEIPRAPCPTKLKPPAGNPLSFNTPYLSRYFGVPGGRERRVAARSLDYTYQCDASGPCNNGAYSRLYRSTSRKRDVRMGLGRRQAHSAFLNSRRRCPAPVSTSFSVGERREVLTLHIDVPGAGRISGSGPPAR
ncbi:hypothetical protein R3P38DRAFT_3448963 [Favolaschia claudopus]|uniref:Uncharacterized protein n=1 Tax=Favolaschia claudopus TaxID=2862362 RepID=A0AAW0CRY8_9AGAR